MKTHFIFFLLLLIVQKLFGQFDPPIPDLIDLAKKRSLPVICADSTFSKNTFSTGTAVLLGRQNKIFALTCEHVIAIKDTLGRTIRYVNDIYINMNKKDSTSQSIKMTIIYADESNDFAILGIMDTKININLMKDLDFVIIPPSACKGTTDFKEGEKVLYIGYPLSMGINERNYPLSRVGMISQLIPRSNNFIIDGFVQHGHSGSPVFLIHYINETNDWTIYLIGIATSFPNEYGNVYKKVQYKLISGVNTELNPGFTYVTSMNKIIPIINKILTIN